MEDPALKKILSLALVCILSFVLSACKTPFDTPVRSQPVPVTSSSSLPSLAPPPPSIPEDLHDFFGLEERLNNSYSELFGEVTITYSERDEFLVSISFAGLDVKEAHDKPDTIMIVVDALCYRLAEILLDETPYRAEYMDVTLLSKEEAIGIVYYDVAEDIYTMHLSGEEFVYDIPR